MVVLVPGFAEAGHGESRGQDQAADPRFGKDLGVEVVCMLKTLAFLHFSEAGNTFRAALLLRGFAVAQPQPNSAAGAGCGLKPALNGLGTV